MFLTVDHEKKVVIFLVYSSPNGENVQRMYKQRSLLFSSYSRSRRKSTRRDYKIKNIRKDWEGIGAHYHDIPFAYAGWNTDGNDLLCFTLMTAPFLFFYVGSTSSSLFPLWNMHRRYEHTATAKRTENRYSVVASRTGVNPCKSSTLHFFFLLILFPTVQYIRPRLPSIHSFTPPWKNGFLNSSSSYSGKFTKMSTYRGKFLHSIRYFSLSSFQK